MRAWNRQLTLHHGALGQELDAEVDVATGRVDGGEKKACCFTIVADEDEVAQLDFANVDTNSIAGVVLVRRCLGLDEVATGRAEGEPNGQDGRNGDTNLHDESLQVSGLCGLILGAKITGIHFKSSLRTPAAGPQHPGEREEYLKGLQA